MRCKAASSVGCMALHATKHPAEILTKWRVVSHSRKPGVWRFCGALQRASRLLQGWSRPEIGRSIRSDGLLVR